MCKPSVSYKTVYVFKEDSWMPLEINKHETILCGINKQSKLVEKHQ